MFQVELIKVLQKYYKIDQSKFQGNRKLPGVDKSTFKGYAHIMLDLKVTSTTKPFFAIK